MIEFNSIIDLLTKFPDDKSCKKYLGDLRWNGNVSCPRCNHTHVYHFKDGITYKCAGCLQKFNAKTNTVFEETKLSLQKWFLALYLLTSHKKGISSLQLAKDLNITQKTAWFLLHRLRFMITNKSMFLLQNEVEIDETYVGGKNKNRHKNKKVPNTQGRSLVDKTAVIGVVERNGELRTFVVEDVKTETLSKIITENVDTTATLNSDEYVSYRKMGEIYNHKIVNHGGKQFVDGNSHVNTVEGFWSLLKRGIIGIYHFTSRKHLHRYVGEFTFRYNTRILGESERFNVVLGEQMVGKRLPYKILINKHEIKEIKETK